MTFHVPNQFRVRSGQLGSEDTAGNNGVFVMQERVKDGVKRDHGGKGQNRFLITIASDMGGWEHVSVHCETDDKKVYTPRWDEMCNIKALFWDGEDVAVQYHLAASKAVNVHPHTLHLWRVYGGWEDFLPMPPKEFV